MISLQVYYLTLTALILLAFLQGLYETAFFSRARSFLFEWLLADVPKMMKDNRSLATKLKELDKVKGLTPDAINLSNLPYERRGNLEIVRAARQRDDSRLSEVRNQGKLCLVGVTIAISVSLSGLKTIVDLEEKGVISSLSKEVAIGLLFLAGLYFIASTILASCSLRVVPWAILGPAEESKSSQEQLEIEVLCLKWNQNLLSRLYNFASTSLELLLRGVFVLGILILELGTSAFHVSAFGL